MAHTCNDLRTGFDFDEEIHEEFTAVDIKETCLSIASSELPDAPSDKQLERTNINALFTPAKRDQSDVSLKSRKPDRSRQNTEQLLIKSKSKLQKAEQEVVEDQKLDTSGEEELEFHIVRDEEEAAQPELTPEVTNEEPPLPKYPLVLPKLEERIKESRKKRRTKPSRDTRYAEELERQRMAEAIKQRFKDMIEGEKMKSPSPMIGQPDEPIYDDCTCSGDKGH